MDKIFRVCYIDLIVFYYILCYKLFNSSIFIKCNYCNKYWIILVNKIVILVIVFDYFFLFDLFNYKFKVFVCDKLMMLCLFLGVGNFNRKYLGGSV